MNNEGSVQTVLYVDDNTTLLYTRKLIFEMKGYCVLTCEDTHRSLELVRMHPELDIVVTDFDFGEGRQNGLQCSEAIHAIRSDLPIILFTGMPWRIPEDRPPCIAAIVEKNLDPEVLIDAVALVLAQSKQIPLPAEGACDPENFLKFQARLEETIRQAQEHILTLGAHIVRAKGMLVASQERRKEIERRDTERQERRHNERRTSKKDGENGKAAGEGKP